MPKILYSSGRELYVAPEELSRTILKFQNAGVRMTKVSTGNFLFLNSSTMDYLDVSDMEKNVVLPMSVVDEAIPTPGSDSQCPAPIVPEYIDPVAAFERETKTESATAKEARVLDEIVAKSNCEHKGTLTLYKQQTVKGEKYFQKCSFCGWRGRFVKASSLTADELSKVETYRGE